MGLFGKKKEVFSGKLKALSNITTTVSGTTYFGILFEGNENWIRLATPDYQVTESIAFLQPGQCVEITVTPTYAPVKNIACWLVKSVAVKPSQQEDHKQ